MNGLLFTGLISGDKEAKYRIPTLRKSTIKNKIQTNNRVHYNTGKYVISIGLYKMPRNKETKPGGFREIIAESEVGKMRRRDWEKEFCAKKTARQTRGGQTHAVPAFTVLLPSNYRTLSGLKQHRFIILQFCRQFSKMHLKNQSFSRAMFLSRSPRWKCFLAFCSF